MGISYARSHPLAFLSGFPKRLHADNHIYLQRRFHQKATVRSFGALDQEGDKSTLDDTTTSVALKIPREQDTEEIGGLFAALLFGKCFVDEDIDRGVRQIPEGATIFLDGDLGAGKTAFARGFLRAATGNDDLRVTSPTFLLVNVYPILGGRIEIHHMDLYRLKGDDPKDFTPLNLDYVFQKHVSLIEWPQRMGCRGVPGDRLDINIQILSSNDNGAGDNDNLPRLMKIQPHGSIWKKRIHDILDEGYLDDLLVML